MQTYLPACKIVTTHGVRGEMKALPLCDGAEFLAKFKRLFAQADGSGEVRVLGVRAQGNMILLRLDGVGDMDAARAQVGRTYYFAKSDVRLPKGRYFIDDLLGCRVVDAATGAEYGTLTDVDHPAAQDIYTVTDANGGTHMLPAVPEFVQKIDLETRTITVTPIDGMFTEALNGDKE
ncbi:MAG: ribosome maturation factor RimM [Blautia massiliensis (ex Durand et al. 2017)]|nr:MAG: 16S rRNA processing protein RimM [Subdoligranulum variabile]